MTTTTEQEITLVDDYKRFIDSGIKGMRVKRGEEQGLYGFLAKRAPLYIDEQIPPAAMKCLREHDAPACANENGVYFSTDLAVDTFKQARQYCLKRNLSGAKPHIKGSDIYENTQALIAHEYTHVFMGHAKKCAKFVEQYGTDDYQLFSYACEIEANRGLGIDHYSDIYRFGITDDTFPETKFVDGLMNIYETLKKHYGQNIKKFSEQEKKRQNGENVKDTEMVLTDRQKTAIGISLQQVEAEQAQAEQLASTMTDEELDNIKLDPTASKGKCKNAGKDNNKQPQPQPQPVSAMQREYEAEQTKKMVEKNLSRLTGLVTGRDISATKVKTYSRMSRRNSQNGNGNGNGLMRKGVKQGKHNAPKVLIGLDNSGSMDEADVTNVARAVGSVVNLLGTNTKGSYICTHNSYTANMNNLRDWKEVVDSYRACGGTNFNELLREALKCNVEAVINVGDGLDTLTDKKAIEKAVKRKMRWIDVTVMPAGYDYEREITFQKDWIEEQSEEELKHFNRELIDLTQMQ